MKTHLPLIILTSLILHLSFLKLASAQDQSPQPQYDHSPQAQCSSLLKAMATSTAEDWGHTTPSLLPMIVSNISMLIGVEALRAHSGWTDAFSNQFYWNTPLDTSMTILAHNIAIGRAPGWLKSLSSGKFGMLARATTNTFLNTAVILAFWATAAVTQQKEITSFEASQALGLCTAYYFCIQVAKNEMFIKLPRRFDEAQLKKIEAELGVPFAQLLFEAQKRSQTLKIDQKSVRILFMSTLDEIVHQIEWEKKLLEKTAEIKNLASGNDLLEIATQIESENKASKKIKLRRQLLWKILDLIESESAPESVLAPLLDLGKPFTHDQSLALHRSLKARYWRNRFLVGFASIGDQLVGVGLMGGVILRGLTQSALHQ